MSLSIPRIFLLVVLLALASGCAGRLDSAILASNATALALAETRSQLVEQRRRDQLEAAAAVDGEAEKMAAAAEVGRRYRPAWRAYEGARFAWLRLVAAIKIAQANPELGHVASLVDLAHALALARADLEAAVLDAIRGSKALRNDAPAPAPAEALP